MSDETRGGEPSSGGSSPRASRERKSMLLRLDPAVHEALAHWAAEDLRSTNAHVEWLLRRALEQAGRMGKGDRD